MSHSTSQRRFLIEVRRRGWVVALSTILVVGVAWGVDKALPSSFNAEAILVVHAPGPLADQPDSSTSLATTYATVISLDPRVKRTVERALPEGSASYTISSDPNTAVLRVSFSARTEADAIYGATVIARAVSGAHPVSKNITPNTVAIVRLPTSASTSFLSANHLGLGVIFGALLGFVLLAFWRPRDVRVDTLQELRHHFECPCLEVHLDTMSGILPLADALASAAGPTTVVVPCRARDARVAASLSQALQRHIAPEDQALKRPVVPESLMLTGRPGVEDAGELPAASADNTILVVSRGVRLAELRDAGDILDRYGTAPDYVVLVT